jgi:hypothetical protein
MSEHVDENEDLSVPSQTDMDVVSLIKKMQQQLNFLEKKIDLLIGQSPDRPRFSKPPFRPSFGGAGKRDFHRGPREGGFNRAPREGGFSGSRPPREGGFNLGPREGGFSHSRPPREGGFSSSKPREGGFGQERSFDRKPGAGARGGFGHGDKPFFRHRKGPR